MIISRKKFNEAIEKALQEAEEKRWVHQRISETENCIHRRMDAIEDRLRVVENLLNQPIKVCDEIQPSFGKVIVDKR